VLPPSPLPSTTTISIPSYTTSLYLGAETTTTIAMSVPPIVTNSMQFYNVNVTSG